MSGKKALLIEEVQMFPQARAVIKYLVADGRYDYLETGSLISIKENVRDIVIPSEEHSLCMYPLAFEEFADALGENLLIKYIKECFVKREPLERGIMYILLKKIIKAVYAYWWNATGCRNICCSYQRL